jgi:hypothetical protein
VGLGKLERGLKRTSEEPGYLETGSEVGVRALRVLVKSVSERSTMHKVSRNPLAQGISLILGKWRQSRIQVAVTSVAELRSDSSERTVWNEKASADTVAVKWNVKRGIEHAASER